MGEVTIPNITSADGTTLTAEETIQINDVDVPVVFNGTLEDDGSVSATIDMDLTNYPSIEKSIRATFAPAVTISSGVTLTSEDVSTGLKNVTLSRVFNQGWNTICLPFDFPLETLGATYAQEFSNADENGLDFSQVESESGITTLKANTPYLIYFYDQVDSPKYFGAEVQELSPIAVPHGDYNFQGNYTAGLSMYGNYGVANIDGKQYIRRGGSNSTLKATGAYFTSSSSSSVQSMIINLGGETTGIDNVSTVTDGNANGPVYNLQGIRVSNGSTDNLPKGIYLQNGKKIYVK